MQGKEISNDQQDQNETKNKGPANDGFFLFHYPINFCTIVYFPKLIPFPAFALSIHIIPQSVLSAFGFLELVPEPP